jgi:hypothetical protein
VRTTGDELEEPSVWRVSAVGSKVEKHMNVKMFADFNLSVQFKSCYLLYCVNFSFPVRNRYSQPVPV